MGGGPAVSGAPEPGVSLGRHPPENWKKQGALWQPLGLA